MYFRAGMWLLGFSALFLGESTHRQDVRYFTNFGSFIVSVDRTSPPMAALEDLHQSRRVQENPPKPLRITEPLEVEPGARRIDLGGFVISRVEVRQLETIEKAYHAAQERKPSGIEAPPEMGAKAEVPQPVDALSWDTSQAPYFSHLPDLRSGSIETTQDLAASPKSEKDKEKEIATFIAGLFKPSGLPTQGNQPDPEGRRVAQNDRAPMSRSGDGAGVVRGHVDLQGGLAYTGEDLGFYVYRYHGGQVEEVGAVDLSRGEYEIEVASREGLLRGELRNARGELLGRGELELAQVTNGKLDLKISPATSEVTGQLLTSLDEKGRPLSSGRVQVEGLDIQAQADSKGVFRVSDLARGSSVILRSEAEDHRPSMALVSVSERASLRMLPNRLLKTFFDLVSGGLQISEKDFEQYGIVWGRVLNGEKPVKGAEVSIDDGAAIGPVFLNDFFLPDTNQKQTSSNGIFFFLKVNEGLVTLNARWEGKSFPARLIPTAARHLSYAALETGPKNRASIHFFDAFNSKPVAGSVGFSGSDNQAKTDAVGRIQISLGSGSGPAFLDVFPGGDYMDARFSIQRTSRYVEVPLFQKEWIDSFANHMRVNQDPNLAIVLGRIEATHYEVFMDRSHPSSSIFYFDEKGQPKTQSEGSRGFVIFNSPVGMRTLSISVPGAKGVFSHALPLEPGQVGTISY